MKKEENENGVNDNGGESYREKESEIMWRIKGENRKK
jgi:hypothetical protein